ncbi:dioxygenase family protein [Ideonella sp. BN130291]|uniref:dioxygenase family protein n=1 Tax=Ideonella sp. BN130291 TaxID=3112940 RepID=UPI002E26F307|nr:class III extradiol ring-cleavage dioxygenase [Ideonella sp. BN130291]
MNTLPSLFVSHGSPMIALEPGLAGAFLARLGPAIDATFGRPRAIVAISAHTLARAPVALGAARHDTIHDFGGFPPALYALRYDAPGDPALAADVVQRLAEHGIAAQRSEAGGLDHGIWTALRYVYPEADVPIVPLAFVHSESPARQFALGAALAPLREQGVLVLGTGSITHNLRRLFGGVHGRPDADAPEIEESAAFRRWMAERSAARDWDALWDYRAKAPFAAEMHPTDEHLLPWFATAGSGGLQAQPVRLHDSVSFGALGMDTYAFGEPAAALAAALAS